MLLFEKVIVPGKDSISVQLLTDTIIQQGKFEIRYLKGDLKVIYTPDTIFISDSIPFKVEVPVMVPNKENNYTPFWAMVLFLIIGLIYMMFKKND